MTNNLCIYHRDADGCAAAAVVKLSYSFEQFEFVSAQYGEDPPDCTGKNVIIVDFCYKPEVMLRLFQQAESVLVIDHHKTAMKDMAKIMEDIDSPKDSRTLFIYREHKAVFDMEMSGATLAWDVLNKTNSNVPEILKYIQDNDLQTSKMKNSKEIHNGLQCYPLDVDVYAHFITAEWRDTCVALLNDGVAITKYQDIQIKKAVSRARVNDFAGYAVPVLNHTDGSTLSDICGKMAVGYPFAVCYQDIADRRIYNLRSSEDGLDVSEIAYKFGGGGHKHAAGFVMQNDQNII